MPTTPARIAKRRALALARMAKPLLIPCTFCGATIGQPCLTKHGQPIYNISQMHDARLSPSKPITSRYHRFRGEGGCDDVLKSPRAIGPLSSEADADSI